MGDVAGGSLLNSTELDIAVDGAVLDITLGFDAWLEDVGAPGASTTALLQGFVSAQNESGGWGAVVSSSLTHEHVTRVDDSTVRISVRAEAYDLTVPETITVTVPWQAMSSQVRRGCSWAT